MICYKDKTWCPFDKCKDWKKCDKALTKKVRKNAEKWMKDPPISVYVDKPECFKV